MIILIPLTLLVWLLAALRQKEIVIDELKHANRQIRSYERMIKSVTIERRKQNRRMK